MYLGTTYLRLLSIFVIPIVIGISIGETQSDYDIDLLVFAASAVAASDFRSISISSSNSAICIVRDSPCQWPWHLYASSLTREGSQAALQTRVDVDQEEINKIEIKRNIQVKLCMPRNSPILQCK